MSSSTTRRDVLALLGIAALALAGCGRKAEPKPPPDADPRAPRMYPAPSRTPPGERAPPPPTDPAPAVPDPVPPAPLLPPSFR